MEGRQKEGEGEGRKWVQMKEEREFEVLRLDEAVLEGTK